MTVEGTDYYFRKAARIMDVGERIETLLATPLREVKVQVSIELDSGEPYFLRGEPTELAQQVNDLLDDAGSACPRLTHGMNDWTWPLVQDAFRRGHDTRVGFEDSVLLPDGARAENNAQLVKAAVGPATQVRCAARAIYSWEWNEQEAGPPPQPPAR